MGETVIQIVYLVLFGWLDAKDFFEYTTDHGGPKTRAARGQASFRSEHIVYYWVVRLNPGDRTIKLSPIPFHCLPFLKMLRRPSRPLKVRYLIAKKYLP